MQHFLASRQGTDIPVKHLFVEYKYWIESLHPFDTVRDEVAALARQGDDFRRLLEPKVKDPLYPLLTFLAAFDVRTAYPFLLAALDAKVGDDDLRQIGEILESYLLRRAVCELTTKNYNRIFLSLTKSLKKDGFGVKGLTRVLVDQDGDSTGWPSDAQFGEAWRTMRAYSVLNNAKLAYIFRRLNATYMNRKMEELTIDSPVTIEHILPQSWVSNWPLIDGSRGLSVLELIAAPENDPIADATRRRNHAIQTLGNLTIVTQGLNSAASNSSWHEKQSQLRNSLLPINQSIASQDRWDESTISNRSLELFRRALEVWPRGGQASVIPEQKASAEAI